MDGGLISPDAKMLAQANRERARVSLVPGIHAQVAFWEKAVLAVMAGLNGRKPEGEEMGAFAARQADALTREWLRRLKQWSEE